MTFGLTSIAAHFGSNMGRYLSSNLSSSSVNKTLKSYCKIRYLMSHLRKYPRLAEAPLSLHFHRNSLPSPPHAARCTRKSTSKHFHRLSRHINVYFQRKDAEPLAENVGLAVTSLEYLGRAQRRSHSQRAGRERKISEGKDTTQTLKCKDKQESSGTSASTQGNSGLQLFHTSSLVTTFGESYNYVANHINSVFSRNLTSAQIGEDLETTSSTRGINNRHKRRKMQNTYVKNSQEDVMSQVKSGADRVAVGPTNPSGSWEEGYLHLARHINKYFGAKVADEAGRKQQIREQHPVGKSSVSTNPFSTPSTSQTEGVASQLKQDEPANPESGGLFHSSQTTNFGENYFKMAGHINQYFKGQSELDEDTDMSPQIEADPGSITAKKTVSFMDFLRHPTDLLGSYLKLGSLSRTNDIKPATRSPGSPILGKKLTLGRRQAEEMTRGLIGNMAQASSPEALTACMEALNEHLIRNPSCKAFMWQEKTAVTLLRKRRSFRDNQALQSALRETLALIGYMDPVKGRGIRVLSIDGGGTRGVVPLQVLKLLEAETGKKIHQLFDYICGVSTGAVLAFMLGLAHFSLEECADMYRRFGSEVFRQNPLVGTVKMGWSHSYYNTETWETILREKLGHRVLIKTARDELSPKVSAVSAVVNWGTSPKAFVFRNYNHKPGSLSRYAGASGCQMWQAVRASSAAPGYFQEFTLQSDIHQDGGILLNNPCALAVHESRLLWPNQPFQCVLSLGTGRYDNAKKAPATSTSWRAKISNLICSATDTEGVHTLLDELLAPDVYFRFNPMLSAVVSLDESRPQALDQLQRDTQDYLERNRLKLARLCLVLGAERSAFSRTKDWMGQRAWEMKQRWV